MSDQPEPKGPPSVTVDVAAIHSTTDAAPPAEQKPNPSNSGGAAPTPTVSGVDVPGRIVPSQTGPGNAAIMTPGEERRPDTPGAVPGLPAAEQARGREQVIIRFHSTPAQQAENDRRLAGSEWPHATPNSVYLAAMGNHWRPGSWARVMDMMHYAQERGVFCVLEELQDRCLNPYDGLGTMRNEAWLKADAGGFEYVCYLDNDVLPPKDTLLRLVSRQALMVAPWIEEPPKPTGEPVRILHGPVMRRYTGVQKVKWHVLTMFLMRTAILRPFMGSFWMDAAGADEGFHVQKLHAATGIQPTIDTDAIVEVAAPPTYPLTVHKLPPEEKEAYWTGKKVWLYGTADRRAIDPTETRIDQNGIYLPFLAPKPAPTAAPVAGGPAGSMSTAPQNGSGPVPGKEMAVVAAEDLRVLVEEVNRLREVVKNQGNGHADSPTPAGAAVPASISGAG